MSQFGFSIEVRQGNLVVSLGREFCAIYFKPSNQPQLILRHRTQTVDDALLAQAWQAANAKARELGWIAKSLIVTIGHR